MSLILSTRSIRVEIAQPGEFPNTTTRFDRAGFVTGVTLEDRYQVCAREPDHLSHPSTGGMGLCSEFRLPRPAQEAKAGEWFPKPGVGLLRKDAEGGYVLHQRYPCEPFEVLTQRAGDSVTFLTLPKPCGGYAMQQEKTLRVSGNALAMEITLTNTGSQALELEEYCHNFITIERLPLGEGYSLAMPVVSQDGKAPRRGEALMGRGASRSGPPVTAPP